MYIVNLALWSSRVLGGVNTGLNLTRGNPTWSDELFVTYLHTLQKMPWGRGIVVIASAYITEDPGFESRQGVRVFLVIYALQCSCHNLICIAMHCT
jgi:hypothetical protein